MRRYPHGPALISAFFLLAAVWVPEVSAAPASVLGFRGPIVPNEDGSWKEYRTAEEDALLSPNENDLLCKKMIPQNLRQLLFEHFRYYADHSKSRVSDEVIARFAKVAGMAPYESSGSSAVVSDMKHGGGEVSLSHFRSDNASKEDSERPGAHSSLASIDKLMNMVYAPVTYSNGKKGSARRTRTVVQKVLWNNQTNFGLLQMSADRLGVGNGKGQLARAMIDDIRALFLTHPDEVIDRCGTSMMFKDSREDLREAFRAIQTCEVGYKTKEEVQCFGRYAMLCPNYNITLALIATNSYFATSGHSSRCSRTFRRILQTGKARSSSLKPSAEKPMPKYPILPEGHRNPFSHPLPEFGQSQFSLPKPQVRLPQTQFGYFK